MTELEQEIAHLQKLQAKHRKNIHTLEETLANYGMARPLPLLNELDYEREQLRQVEERLARLAAQIETEEVFSVPAEPVRPPRQVPLRVTVPEPEMILIPAGEFLMGTLEADVYATAREYSIERKYIERELPRHKVFVQEFEIGKYPLTNFQYRAFVQDAGREPPGHWKGDKYPEGLHNHPVVSVSWYDAEDYCKWLSEKTGKSYRLPTEAEWEKAARGTDRREFPWGDEWDVSKCNTRDGGPGTTTPVDQYSPHGEGYYEVADMAGNVWEWCADWLNAYPGNPFPDEDYGETYKVLRGGSWNHGQVGARCAYRNWFEPRNRIEDVGFRCVRGSQ
jgi:formylglycine-generating enzyme required for sulfatase activity